jgi:hypothetical protein
MKDSPSLGLTVLLLVGGCLSPTGAPPSSQLKASTDISRPTVKPMEAAPGDQGEGPILGTVRRVDRRTGVITLDTPSGPVELVSTPAEIQDVEIGDVIVVHVEEDESILTGEEPRPPPFTDPSDLTPIGGGIDEPPR